MKERDVLFSWKSEANSRNGDFAEPMLEGMLFITAGRANQEQYSFRPADRGIGMRLSHVRSARACCNI